MITKDKKNYYIYCPQLIMCKCERNKKYEKINIGYVNKIIREYLNQDKEIFKLYKNKLLLNKCRNIVDRKFIKLNTNIILKYFLDEYLIICSIFYGNIFLYITADDNINSDIFLNKIIIINILEKMRYNVILIDNHNANEDIYRICESDDTEMKFLYKILQISHHNKNKTYTLNFPIENTNNFRKICKNFYGRDDSVKKVENIKNYIKNVFDINYNTIINYESTKKISYTYDSFKSIDFNLMKDKKYFSDILVIYK
jgi:hypothetical protein